MGFKNARKATSYAAEAAAEKLAVDARRMGFGQVHAVLVRVVLGLSWQFSSTPVHPILKIRGFVDDCV